LSPIDKADFYVLIYWTTWTGRLNKDHVKIWEDSAYAKKQANIKVIKVNMDFQKNWDQADKDIFIVSTKKKRKKLISNGARERKPLIAANLINHKLNKRQKMFK